MVNPFKDTNWNPDRAERRSFARSLMIGFPILAVVLALVRTLAGHPVGMGFVWFGLIGAAAGAVFWVLPQIAKPFYIGWYFIACCMGIVVSNTLLAASYYLVMTPVGLIMRLMGHDPMRRKFDRQASTYWSDPETISDPDRYFRQY